MSSVFSFLFGNRCVKENKESSDPLTENEIVDLVKLNLFSEYEEVVYNSSPYHYINANLTYTDNGKVGNSAPLDVVCILGKTYVVARI